MNERTIHVNSVHQIGIMHDPPAIVIRSPFGDTILEFGNSATAVDFADTAKQLVEQVAVKLGIEIRVLDELLAARRNGASQDPVARQEMRDAGREALL